MKKDILIVFYDGWCPLCQRAKQNIQKLDRRGQILFYSIREPTVFREYHLDGLHVEERIYSIRKRDGSSFSGIYTIVEIAKRIPRYRVFVPLLSMSIVLGFGQKVYDWIASKREIVPIGQCTEDGCPVHFDQK
ncbi:thiol-disulfide oxidoreductase DCC family protein [Salinibacillus xinjiangensis]|uniref:DUF393 domain-containing protein n=1 Tax=Salinibacillus xinjiangensis TaxID=1229268 RepID=A0A6G1X2V6_9BACI|nr:DUF393 domain-containing protein [Salinibacillus xinjiangensis]MRG85323.1 DUF393 domain-containing protein [Salinibacillus xinjiangensis]